MAELEHGVIVLLGDHGGLQLLDVLPAVGALILEEGLDTVKIVVPEGIAAADDKAAVVPDDVGIHQRVGVFRIIEGKGFSNVRGGQRGNQSGAFLAILHGIGGRDA